MYRTAKKDPTFLITRGPTNNHSIDFENVSVIEKVTIVRKGLEP